MRHTCVGPIGLYKLSWPANGSFVYVIFFLCFCCFFWLFVLFLFCFVSFFCSFFFEGEDM